MARLFAALIGSVMLGCGSPAPGMTPHPTSASSNDTEYELMFHVDSDVITSETPITGEAALRKSSGDAATISGSGSNLIGFRFEGSGQLVEPAFSGDCHAYPIAPNRPLTQTIVKSGTFDDRRPAEVGSTFFAEPSVYLSVGTWTITAIALFYKSNDCASRRIELETPVVIHVV